MAVLSDAVLKRIGEVLGNHKHEMSFRILHTSSSKSWNEFNFSNGYVRDRSIELGEQKGVVVECSLRCMANS